MDGWKFRRQQPIGPYFADFCCPAARLIIEIDGPGHDESQWAYDERRQAFLETEGYRIVRFGASEVTRDFEFVIEQILAELLERERLGFRKRPRP
jgi:very-short-patch-repair endonuclease